MNPGDSIAGRITVLELLPELAGAPIFGRCARAREEATGRELWLTQVEPALVPTPTRRAELSSAANQSARASGPGVLETFAVENVDGSVYVGHLPMHGAQPYAMSPAFGHSDMASNDVVEFARALARMHDRGLVHGAVCLASVCRGPEGVATWQHGFAGACEPSNFSGRARGLTFRQPFPPEFLAFGGRPTTATDVFAWAFAACQMISGRPDASSIQGIVAGVGELDGEHPLVQVLKSCLNDNAAARPRDAKELWERLERESLVSAPAAPKSRSSTVLAPLAPPPMPQRSGVFDMEAPPPPPSLFGTEADFDELDGEDDYEDLAVSEDDADISAAAPLPTPPRPPTAPRPAATPTMMVEAGSVPPPAPAPAPGARPPAAPRPGSQPGSAPPPAPARRDGEPETMELDMLGDDFLSSLDRAVANERGSAQPGAPSSRRGGQTQAQRQSPGQGQNQYAEMRDPGEIELASGPGGEMMLDDAIAGLGEGPTRVVPSVSAIERELEEASALPPPQLAPVLTPPGGHTIGRNPGPHGLRPGLLNWVMIVLPLALLTAAFVHLGFSAGGFDVLTGLAPRDDEGDEAGEGESTGGESLPLTLPDIDIAQMPDLPPVAKRCPEGMIALDGEVCVDTGEYPGVGQLPMTRISYAEAEATCQERGARLCTFDEFRTACGGDDHHRFPYGDFYKAYCNVSDGAEPGRVQASGARSRCRSPKRVYDAVGNVGEWVKGGYAVGGDVRTPAQTATCDARGRPPKSFKGEFVGFRCCMDRL